MYINDISAVSVYSESLKFYKVSVPRRTPPGSFSYFIDYLQSYGSACLGIGQCMMMAGQAVSATSSNSMQLMIGKLLAEFTTRSPACTKKTDSRDMATDNAGVPLSDTLRRTGCCVPLTAIPR